MPAFLAKYEAKNLKKSTVCFTLLTDLSVKKASTSIFSTNQLTLIQIIPHILWKLILQVTT